MIKYLIVAWIIFFGICQSQTWMYPYRDAKKLKVSKGYDTTATQIILSTGQGSYLPDSDFSVVWYNSSKYMYPFDDSTCEWIAVGSRSGDTLKSITRAQNRTTKRNHNTAGTTYRVMFMIGESYILKLDSLIQSLHDSIP